MTSAEWKAIVRPILVVAVAGFACVASAQSSDDPEPADWQSTVDSLLDLTFDLEADIAELRELLNPIGSDVDALSERLGALEARVDAMATRPGAWSPRDPNTPGWRPPSQWQLDPTIAGVGGGGQWMEDAPDVATALEQLQQVPGSRIAVEGNRFSFFVPLGPEGRASLSPEVQASLRELGTAETLDLQLNMPEGEVGQPTPSLGLSRLPRGVAYAKFDGETRYMFHSVEPSAQIDAIFEVLDAISPGNGSD